MINSVGDFCLFLAKLAVASGTAVFVLYALRDRADIHYIAVPVGVASVGAYLVASVFMGLYEMAIDTIFVCFVEDEEKHDGSAAKPYYASDGLLKFMRFAARERQRRRGQKK